MFLEGVGERHAPLPNVFEVTRNLMKKSAMLQESWRQCFCDLFFLSSDTHQSMKTSHSDLKVNRNIYPDVVNVIGCFLIGTLQVNNRNRS